MKKYGNTRTTLNGIVFDSKREANTYFRLQYDEKRGVIKDLKRQVRYNFPDGKGGLIRYQESKRPLAYVADFTYIKDDKLVVADAKGFKTDIYKLKKALMWSLLGIEILEL